jgi:hypothetical protein
MDFWWRLMEDELIQAVDGVYWPTPPQSICWDGHCRRIAASARTYTPNTPLWGIGTEVCRWDSLMSAMMMKNVCDSSN